MTRPAALLSGDLKKAASWYFADRIDAVGGLTAEALVLQGRACDFLRYIESLEADSSGSRLSRAINAVEVNIVSLPMDAARRSTLAKR